MKEDANHYVFRSVWTAEAPFDVVCAVLRDVPSYAAWWPEIRSVEVLEGRRFAMVARSSLPYELRFVSHDRSEGEAPGVLPADLTGDLEGFARWTVEDLGPTCRLVYDQEVTTNKRLLNALTPVARPAFRANHWMMMRHGQAGLRTFLAGVTRAPTILGDDAVPGPRI